MKQMQQILQVKKTIVKAWQVKAKILTSILAYYTIQVTLKFKNLKEEEEEEEKKKEFTTITCNF